MLVSVGFDVPDLYEPIKGGIESLCPSLDLTSSIERFQDAFKKSFNETATS